MLRLVISMTLRAKVQGVSVVGVSSVVYSQLKTNDRENQQCSRIRDNPRVRSATRASRPFEIGWDFDFETTR